MQHHRSLILLVALVAGVLSGCGGDDSDDAAPDPTVDQADAAPVAEVREVALLPADSPYVDGLCSIDFFDPTEPDDPLSWVIDEIAALPTTDDAEAEEQAWLVERLEQVEELEDPRTTDDLRAAGAVLAARCSP